MKKSNRNVKLALYSAMGIGASTFGASATNADICYTDLTLTGSELVFTTSAPFSGIDLDDDGNADFQIDFGTFGPNAFSTSSWLLNMIAAPGGPATNAVAANTAFAGLSNIASGGSISSRNFSGTGYFQQAYTSYNPSNVYGAWQAGTSGFAGVRFEDGSGTVRFGWVEATVEGSVANGDFSDIVVTISRYAFAKDEAIVAGQSESASVPEPTSLGLLAMGGLGLIARRRRKGKIA